MKISMYRLGRRLNGLRYIVDILARVRGGELYIFGKGIYMSCCGQNGCSETACGVSKNLFDIFVDPKTGHKLIAVDQAGGCCGSRAALINDQTGTGYPIVSGIACFLKEGDISGRNARYQGLYDGFAFWYDLAQWFGEKFWVNKTDDLLVQRIKDLNITSGERVLEISVGTGEQLKKMPQGIEFYGVDISMGMLERCLRKRRKCNFPITLAWAKAEELPFADNSFDVILHVGGINFFTDKAKALSEMARVAKPGARFVIADETEKLAKEGETTMFAKQFFVDRDEEIVPPVDLLPDTLEDVKLEHRTDGSLYIITAHKRG
ncbi:MAG: Methyltransferase type 11 [candidate division TM6 bacterium GW2011_GWE2_41_16]|nr:MAG: Methyltransferase type 11 [candidate division TM6 bacterium GW2011_GWE2_41_16]